MADEHACDRYTEAKESAKRAEEEAEKLVCRFVGAADRLRTWRAVTFRWRAEDGTLQKLIGPEENTICIGEIPSLQEVQKSVTQWRESINALRNIETSLTDEERNTLELRSML